MSQNQSNIIQPCCSEIPENMVERETSACPWTPCRKNIQILLVYYRPHSEGFRKVMLSQVSVCPRGEGGVVYPSWLVPNLWFLVISGGLSQPRPISLLGVGYPSLWSHVPSGEPHSRVSYPFWGYFPVRIGHAQQGYAATTTPDQYGSTSTAQEQDGYAAGAVCLLHSCRRTF